MEDQRQGLSVSPSLTLLLSITHSLLSFPHLYRVLSPTLSCCRHTLLSPPLSPFLPTDLLAHTLPRAHYKQMKTWSVALCLCLNVGVDPPDVVKTNPCARRECWIGMSTPPLHHLTSSPLPLSLPPHPYKPDPLSMSPQKAIEQIGTTLQKQYERWQPRARYKVLLDPTTEDTRKLCISLRKTAKVTGV